MGLQVQSKCKSKHSARGSVSATLSGYGETINNKGRSNIELELRVPRAKLWHPDHPHLYKLTVEQITCSKVIDSYSLNVGIRTVEVTVDQLLLNGEPINLVGFGRHDDFPIYGRGYSSAVIIKDYALMKWVGANPFEPLIILIRSR